MEEATSPTGRPPRSDRIRKRPREESTMRRTAIATFLTLMLGGLLVAGCGSGNAEVTTDETSTPVPAATPPEARAAAPDFSGTTIAGQPVSLEGYGGKPLVLVFWGSW
jgi:cytochrome oxidase Cu insertion factor (SCO1/SenC/PrrC family)